MSYYSILPSQRVGNSTGSFTASQNPDPMRPLLTPEGGFRTRDLDPNELSSTRLNAITAQDSDLMRRADARGRAFANSRGLSNSSMAAGAAQGAVIDAATPFAMQEAGAYTNIGDSNMGAENTYLLRRGDWNNALALSRGNNNTSLEIAGMNNEENRRQFDQQFAESGRRYDIDYQREQDMQDRTNRMNRNNFIQSGIFNTIMQDPSIWRDPAGAMGFANYYTTNFGTLWDSLFGGEPEPVAP